MVDYSLPVAKRTRMRRAMASEEHLERRKKRKKKNRADSASANIRGQVSSDRFGEISKRVNTSQNCSINRRMKSEPVALSNDSDDDSVEEIDGSTFGREGGDSVTFVASPSSGLKDVKKFSTCLKGGIIDIIDLDDDEEEEEGFDSVNSNCSISKSAAVGNNGDFVCFDGDNEDGSSGLISCGKENNALEISPNKSMRGSNSGGSYRAGPAVGDREKSKEKNAFGGSNSGGSYRVEPTVGNREKNKEKNALEGSNSGGSYRVEPTVGNREKNKEKNALGGSNSGGLYRVGPTVGNREKNKENNALGGSHSGGSYRVEPTVGNREKNKEKNSLGGSNSGSSYMVEPTVGNREKNKEKNALGGSNSGGSYRTEPTVGKREKNKEKNASEGSNFGGSYRAESAVGDQEKSEECSSDDDDGVEESTESGASSSEEDNDDSSDGTYELEKSEESSSETSSSESGKSHGRHCAGTKSRRERKKRVKIFEGGLRRRAYGLDIFVDFDKDEHNSNCMNEDVKVDDQLNYVAVAQRTRSRFNPWVRKINTDLGTVSQPLCIDEEGSDFQCDERELDSSSRHGSTDSCDSTTDDENFKESTWSSEKKTEFNNQSGDKIYERRTWSSEVKAEVNSQSGNDTNKVESFHGGSKLQYGESVPRMNKRNQSEDCEDFQKAHPKNCHEFDNITKTKGRSASKNLDVYNILIDSIIADKELPSDELVLPINQVSEGENSSLFSKMPLPLKFFGFEESRIPEKSEHDKEMDKLWAELDFALTSSEIGLVDSNTVENEDGSPSKVQQVDLCLRGDHRLVLDEQIGLRCTCCSYVKLEIKDILPSFGKNPNGKSQKREYGSFEHVQFDGLQQDFDCDPHDGSDSQAHVGRTVWDIIPGLRNSMYPHQREGFEFIWKNIAGGISLDELRERKDLNSGSGCLVSHAPGTGKTRLSIVFLQTYMELYPTCRPMIIAPSSMLLTWEEEFLKWKVDIPFHNLNKHDFSFKENIAAVQLLMQASTSRQSVTNVRLVKLFSWKKEKSILGISYRLFERLAGVQKKTEGDKVRKILLELPDLVVLDEGHIPRNDDSLIWMALSKIKTEKRIILSGTPFQNNFTEFYTTLRLARPSFADINSSNGDESLGKKRGRPKNIMRGKWGSLISSLGRTSEDLLESPELKEIRALISPFVHVYRGNILQEKLPGLKKSVVILQPTELQKSLLQSIQVRKNPFDLEFAEALISVHPSLILERDKDDFLIDKDMLERGRLNPEWGVKLQLVLEIIRLSKALNEKVLVFSQYVVPLSFIEEHLKSHFNWTEGKELFHMSGKCDIKKRQSLINTLNDPTSEVRVLLASTKACSEGINLVGASRVILLDVAWNPSVERQALCRAYRLGQKKVVYVYHLITSGAREENKYSRQVAKYRLSELVFSPEQSINQVKFSSADLDDKILEELLQHEKLKNIFQKIAYQSKGCSMDKELTSCENDLTNGVV